jgi:hypothetical protein
VLSFRVSKEYTRPLIHALDMIWGVQYDLGCTVPTEILNR